MTTQSSSYFDRRKSPNQSEDSFTMSSEMSKSEQALPPSESKRRSTAIPAAIGTTTNVNRQTSASKSRSAITFSMLLIGLFVALGTVIVLAVQLGQVDISPLTILQVVWHKATGFGSVEEIRPATVDIIWAIRLPRIVLAVFVGAGLSVAGVIIQAIVKNSLADPFILGVSSGASLGATIAVMVGTAAWFGTNSIGVAATIGAFGASILVLAIANVKGPASPVKLLLAGVAISSMFSAFSSFVVYLSPNTQGLKTVTFWLLGGLGGATWEKNVVLALVVTLGCLFFLSQYRTLNLMLLGDEVAITLGKRLSLYRQTYIVLISTMVGFIVFNSGLIGFVGLIIPHVTRILVRSDHRHVIPIAMVIGAIFLVVSDVVARIIMQGTEIPVGIIISLIGAPAFVYLLVNQAYGFGN